MKFSLKKSFVFALKSILGIFLLIVLYISSNILIAKFTEFKPLKVQNLGLISQNAHSADTIPVGSTLSFFIWNIGYGGLGAETDFFYDGGKMSVVPKSWVDKYTQGIYKTIKEHGNNDFFFFQEVDRKGWRSHDVDEVVGISASLPGYSSAFALNYDVKFLPMPWLSPMGTIYSGLLSCSKYLPQASQRIALPNIDDFPRKLFYLKRCLLVQRYAVSNGKELIAINAHLEAYDEGGKVKKQQMELIRKLMEAEYSKGNYVVLGGDWNIAPPEFNIHKWEREKIDDPLYKLQNDSVYIPKWSFVADRNTPTNRKNNHAFDPQTTYTTVIDYFYVSPNVDVQWVKGVDAGFQYSDHNPVEMKIKLN
ncbi:MAG: Endonuclease/exonuclease/phosphatase [Bacteroidetes bacterium]|nr:Endonuclease/exonuclease/phosphatase [Bacteroidota bacterium]